MTINEIKEQLPDVKIDIGGTILTGVLTGRKLDFPVVFVGRRPFEFSWEAIQRAVNNNTPLKV